jgi:hypothetical protein
MAGHDRRNWAGNKLKQGPARFEAGPCCLHFHPLQAAVLLKNECHALSLLGSNRPSALCYLFLLCLVFTFAPFLTEIHYLSPCCLGDLLQFALSKMGTAERKVRTSDCNHTVLWLLLAFADLGSLSAKNFTSHHLPPVFGFGGAWGKHPCTNVTGQPHMEAQVSPFFALSRN